MAKDPAFLFYDGDAARDVSHMNRLERGCYFDLIQAQRKFGGYTAEQARKILGKDFDSCWDALTLVLTQENGIFFIEWMRDSILKRKAYIEIQRQRIQNYWDKKKKIPRYYRGNTTDIPLENEIENENVIKDKILLNHKSIDSDNSNKTILSNKERNFIPPTIEEVKNFITEKGIIGVDPVRFVAHYETTGWMRGKNKIKNWKACIYTWVKHNE